MGRVKLWAVLSTALLLILLLPWLISGLRHLLWQLDINEQLTPTVRGQSVELDEALTRLIPVPEGYAVVGSIDFTERGGTSAVVGLSAEGSMARVSADFASRMRELGWVQTAADESSLMMTFARSDGEYTAYVTYREYATGTISIVVQAQLGGIE